MCAAKCIRIGGYVVFATLGKAILRVEIERELFFVFSGLREIYLGRRVEIDFRCKATRLSSFPRPLRIFTDKDLAGHWKRRALSLLDDEEGPLQSAAAALAGA